MTPLQIIQDIYAVAKVIYDAVETAKANQAQCKTLNDRVYIVTQSIKNLEKTENLEQYRAGLEALQSCVKECASFMAIFSENHWFKNILKGGSHQERFAALTQKLQESVQLLGLGLGAQQIINREQDIKDEAKDKQAILQQQEKIVALNMEANRKIDKMCLEQADRDHIVMHMLQSMKAQFERQALSVSPKPLIEAHLETAYYELTFERKLNEGSFGKVYLGKWSGQEVAIKTLEGEISQEDWQQFIREVQITSRLHCPHIVQLYAVCLERARPCLVMEYMAQDSLYKVLGQSHLTPTQQKQIALDIAKGLLYLHSHGVVHRDLKSANILLSGYRAKVADFGLSKSNSRSIQSTQTQSTALEWMAPECFQDTTPLTAESDIYSFGMILWEITTGKRPYAQFTGASRERDLLKHLQSGTQETIPPTVPAFYAELIRRCWERNPKQRMSLKTLIEKLEAYVPEKEAAGSSKEKGFSVSYVLKYQDLTRTQELGTGGFGVVYKGTWRNMDVAIKQLLVKNLSKDSQQEFEAEANIMANLRAQNIVQFYGYCMNPERCLVMEYMPRGSLDKVLHSPEHLDWKIRIKIAMDITSGVSFLHAEGIIHRDIKSLNVLLDEHFKAKLTDFGLSRVKHEAQSFSAHHAGVAGTLAWMAPELTFEEGGCTKASDMYSLGITLWELVSRRLPFQEVQKVATIPVKVNNGYRDKIPEECPAKLKTLIPACWDTNPCNRPDAESVVTYFKSEFSDFPLFLKSRKNSATSSCDVNPQAIEDLSLSSHSSVLSSDAVSSSASSSNQPMKISSTSEQQRLLKQQLEAEKAEQARLAEEEEQQRAAQELAQLKAANEAKRQQLQQAQQAEAEKKRLAAEQAKREEAQRQLLLKQQAEKAKREEQQRRLAEERAAEEAKQKQLALEQAQREEQRSLQAAEAEKKRLAAEQAKRAEQQRQASITPSPAVRPIALAPTPAPAPTIVTPAPTPQISEAQVNQLLLHIARGEEDEAKKLLEQQPHLLLKSGRVTDYSNRTLEGTALQLALGAYDERMVKMLLPYFDKLQAGACEKSSQYDAFLQAEKEEQAQWKKAAWDKELAALDDMVTVLQKTSDTSFFKKDATLAAFHEKCETALTTFRNALAPQRVIKGYHFNPQLFITACELNDKHYDAFGGPSDKPKSVLFSVKMIGYIQRFFPANIAQVFSYGLYNVVEKNEDPGRSLKLRGDSNYSFFPLNSSAGVGFEYFIYARLGA